MLMARYEGADVERHPPDSSSGSEKKTANTVETSLCQLVDCEVTAATDAWCVHKKTTEALQPGGSSNHLLTPLNRAAYLEFSSDFYIAFIGRCIAYFEQPCISDFECALNEPIDATKLFNDEAS